MNRYYTGIGSRSTPNDIQEQMTTIAHFLEMKGYILRSGGANGADLAFERGVNEKQNKEIYLPWKGFNNNLSLLYHQANDHGRQSHAYVIAKAIHQAWGKCTDGAKLLHVRNTYQVLGWDLQTPSDFVICWTPGGKVKGGTATAINLALGRNIKVFNLAVEEFVYP